MHPAVPICLVFLGCCTNNIFLEFIVKDYPTAGNIITFSQFLFIAVEGFIFTSNFGRKKPKIAITTYVNMVALFLITSVVNNYAFTFNISMPLHMIFRAGSLMANLVLGVIILKKSYPWYKYLSVVMITFGIIVTTIASSQTMKSDSHKAEEEKDDSQEDPSTWEFIYWLIGIFLLTLALFLSARMGIFQETVYKKHGKHPSEALFYNHALPLPFFLLLTKDLYQHALLFNKSEPYDVLGLGLGIPKMWLFLLGNIISQYVCIRSVFILTTECTSLTVTLVVTLRKFASLLISIIYFKNPFTIFHGIGAAFVFLGTFIFTEVIFNIWKFLKPKRD